MASQGLASESHVDLTACDREPIHVPGSIQGYGLLLLADPQTLSVVAGAGPLEEGLSPDWLGAALPDLLRQDVAALLADIAVGPGGTVVAAPLTVGDARFDVSIHRAGELLLVELEPARHEPVASTAMLNRLDILSQGFERAGDLQALCERAAMAFRALTGFDRVMIYRFLDDEAGRVVAEDRDPSLGTFLHHHFPASDIPRQARALYVRNRIRVIPDAGYVPQPIRPAGFEATDLSDVGLRSISPIHIRYLRNMGVAASASVSIVKDGLLWGLIACHHNSPRNLAIDVRQAAVSLAAALARQIRTREQAEAYRERLRLRATEDGLTARFGTAPTLAAAVERDRHDLRTMLRADGFALVGDGAFVTDGVCPPENVVRDLAGWARLHGGVEPFATHQLASIRPEAASFATQASGLLAVPLLDGRATLLWFRVEQIEEIEWAGNPHKPARLEPGAILSPRASFATWTETVRGQSRRWTLEEVEAAHRLYRAFEDAARSRQLRDLNADLTRTLADKDALLSQKDLLMKEVDHRVQNSLQLVAAFLSMQARAAGPGEVADQLAEAQARLSAVALVHRRLYRDDQIETIDLSRYLEELIFDMRGSLGAEWAARMNFDLAPVLVPTDRAVNVGLILTELVINATKYAYGGGAGPITILLEQHRSLLRLIVADEGQGKSGQHAGFGSRMIIAMVKRLDGEMTFADNQPGLRAILTAPIAG